jgi:hypothetical protein
MSAVGLFPSVAEFFAREVPLLPVSLATAVFRQPLIKELQNVVPGHLSAIWKFSLKVFVSRRADAKRVIEDARFTEAASSSPFACSPF